VFLSLNGDTGCISGKRTRVLRRKLPGYLLKGLAPATKFIDPKEYLIASNMKLSTYSPIGSFYIKVKIRCL